MKRLVFAFVVCGVMSAQMLPMPGPGGVGATPNTFTAVQRSVTNCATATTCVLTVTSTGAGNLLVLSSITTNAVTQNSISAGGTYAHCSNCSQTAGGGNLSIDAGWVLSATGGTTSITVTYSGATGGASVDFREYSYTPGPAVLDASDSSTAFETCNTSCAGQPLTLAGISDVIIQWMTSNNNGVSIASGGYGNLEFPSGAPVGPFADKVNAPSFANIGWSFFSTADFAFGAVAFR